MKFPRHLMILGRKFRVRYMDRIDHDPYLPANASTLGKTHPFDQLIEIAALSHDSEEQIVTTLIHEYLHGALHVSGLSVSMTAAGEESLVTMLTHAVEELIPQLAKIRQESKQ